MNNSGLSRLASQRQRIPAGRNEDVLCSVCTKLDFTKFFTPTDTMPKYMSPTNSLKHKLLPRLKKTDRMQYLTLNHHKSHPQCPFCRMVIHILDSFIDEGVCGASGDTRRELLPESLSMDLDSNAESESYIDHRTNKRVYFPRLRIQCVPVLPLPNEEVASKYGPLLHAHRVSPQVDMGLVKAWIGFCYNQHTQCRSLSFTQGETLNIRLIDVIERYIVRMPEVCGYVALSYVWGNQDVPQLMLKKSTRERLVTGNGLADHHTDLLTTVKDAMKVCEQLEYRYLWIDALCIMQDDPNDQACQILQVHRIYARANLTIVAAEGDSWTGLSGISSARIEGQKLEVVGNFTLAKALDAYDVAVGQSNWNTRAWTLQELYFSRRVLFFTKYQVHFHCPEDVWREDRYLEADPSVDVSSWDTGIHGKDLNGVYLYKYEHISGDKAPRSPMAKYIDLVHGYTARRLTKSSDILMHSPASLQASLS